MLRWSQRATGRSLEVSLWDVPVTVLALRLKLKIRALTYEKKVEKGRPLSRANTQMRRETEAKMLKSARKKMTAISEIKTFAATFEPVML